MPDEPPSQSPSTQPPKLLDQMPQVIRMKHMSLRTEEAYVYHIKKFTLFHNKCHPRDMGIAEIRASLSHLPYVGDRWLDTQSLFHATYSMLIQGALQIVFSWGGRMPNMWSRQQSTD